MDPATATVIVAGIAALTGMLTTVLQYLQGQKISATHKQVSENSHKNDPPTVIDHLGDIKAQLTKLDKRVSRLESKR